MSVRSRRLWPLAVLCILSAARPPTAVADEATATPPWRSTIRGIPIRIAEGSLQETETIGLAFEFGTDSAQPGKLGGVGLAVDLALDGSRVGGHSLRATLAGKGVEIRVSPGIDHTFVLIECLPGDAEWAINTAFKAFAESPVVDASEFERVKKGRLARLKSDRMSGPNRGLYYALQYLVSGDRLTRKWADLEQEIDRLGPEDVQHWIEALAPTRASIIGAAGPLPRAILVRLIDRALTSIAASQDKGPALPPTEPPVAASTKLVRGGIVLIDAPNGPIQVVVASRATHLEVPNRILLQLLCEAKGEFVRQVWVEQQHRAWWASVSLSPWRDSSIAYAVATVPSKELGKIVDDLAHLLGDPQEGVSAEELMRAAIRMAVQQYSAAFGSAGTVSTLLATDPSTDPLKFLAEKRVSKEQMATVWAALDSGTVTLVIGPLGTTKAALSGRQVDVYAP